MRAGMPRRNHGAQHGQKRDRSRTDRPLYRLRALRRRVSHRFGDPQRLSAAARTHRRYRPSTRTGAGFGADPLAALEPRADARAPYPTKPCNGSSKRHATPPRPRTPGRSPSRSSPSPNNCAASPTSPSASSPRQHANCCIRWYGRCSNLCAPTSTVMPRASPRSNANTKPAMTRFYAGRLPCSSSIRPLPTDSDARMRIWPTRTHR